MKIVSRGTIWASLLGLLGLACATNDDPAERRFVALAGANSGCPHTAPSDHAPSPGTENGLTCRYADTCCGGSVTFVSGAGEWHADGVDDCELPPPEAPEQAPELGTPCGPCTDTSEVGYCDPSGTSITHYRCEDGRWVGGLVTWDVLCTPGAS